MPGQNALIRYGFARAEGVPGPMPWFPKWSSEEIKMGRPNEEDPNIDKSGNETQGENLLAEGNWKIGGAPDSESYVPMRAHQHGYYEESVPTAGVNLIELRDFDELADTPVPHYHESLTLAAWRDIREAPAEYTGIEARVTNFKLTAQANKYVMFEHNGLFLRDTYMALPAEVAVNVAYTGGWERRGHRRSLDETGPDVAWKVSTAGALGVAKLRFGSLSNIASLTSVGTVATATTDVPHGLTTGNLIDVLGATPAEYNVVGAAITVTSTTTFTYPIVDADDEPATGTIVGFVIPVGATERLIVDDWIDAYTAAGITKGTREEPVQIRPTMETGDLFTLGDVWRMAPQAPKPVGVGSVRGKLKATSLELEFGFGGGAPVRKVIEGFTFEMGTPWEFLPGVGSKYRQGFKKPDNGKRWWEIGFDRELTDRDFDRALIAGTRVSAYAKFWGSPIGSTGLEDYAEYFVEAATVTDAGGTITSPGSTPEKGVLRAYPVTAGASLCVERYQNTVETIAP